MLAAVSPQVSSVLVSGEIAWKQRRRRDGSGLVDEADMQRSGRARGSGAVRGAEQLTRM